MAGAALAQATTRLAHLTLRENQQSWPVQAHSAGDIAAELRAHGVIAGAEGGYRNPYVWQLEWSVTGKPGTKGCAVGQLQVRLTTITTLPQWAPPRGTPAAVVADWQRFETALRKHVLQHRNLTLNRASQLRPRLLRLTAKDCGALQRGVDYIGQGWVQDLQKINDDYDRRTQHGATENVRWPPDDGAAPPPAKR